MTSLKIPRPRKQHVQFSVVDRSARAPMKNAASCEKQCELQNTLIIGILNAHGGPDPPWPGPRSSEGRYQVTFRVCCITGIDGQAAVLLELTEGSCEQLYLLELTEDSCFE